MVKEQSLAYKLKGRQREENLMNTWLFTFLQSMCYLKAMSLWYLLTMWVDFNRKA